MQSKSVLAASALLAWACAAPLQALAQSNGTPPVVPAAARATTATSATAARSALVQITDDDAHGAFKEGGFNSCTTAGACTYTFNPVATARRRLVQHLNCLLTVGSGGSLSYVALLASNYYAPRHYLPITRSPGNTNMYFVDATINFPFEAGEAPLIYAYSSGTAITDLECTITGRDIALP